MIEIQGQGLTCRDQIAIAIMTTVRVEDAADGAQSHRQPVAGLGGILLGPEALDHDFAMNRTAPVRRQHPDDLPCHPRLPGRGWDRLAADPHTESTQSPDTHIVGRLFGQDAYHPARLKRQTFGTELPQGLGCAFRQIWTTTRQAGQGQIDSGHADGCFDLLPDAAGLLEK